MDETISVSSMRVNAVVVGMTLALTLAGCSSSSTRAKSVSSTTSSAPTRATSTSPRATPSSTENSPDVIDFTVGGSIAGHQVSGKLSNGTLTVPCMGAGANQILTMHWTGDSGSTSLQGEIDFKPGTWTIGSAAAQGSASIGVLGGKAIDNLIGTSGTVTTQTSGGSINAMFAGGADSLHLSGTWTCP